MTSLIDFNKIIDSIINNKEIKEETIKRDYVPIQDIDFYSGIHLGNLLRHNNGIGTHMLGYYGFADENKILLKFNNGKYWEIDRNDKSSQYLPNILFDVLLSDKNNKIRTLVDGCKIKKTDEKFYKYTKYMYKMLEDKESKDFNIKKIEVLKKCLKSIVDNENVAIRMGGEHTQYLLYILKSMGLIGNVKWIIDNDTGCYCSRYGIPVISMNQVRNYPIEKVLLSSLKYREELVREKDLYSENTEVIDIYDAMSESDINCKNAFYMFECKKSGEDIGFPYDEVRMRT